LCTSVTAATEIPSISPLKEEKYMKIPITAKSLLSTALFPRVDNSKAKTLPLVDQENQPEFDMDTPEPVKAKPKSRR
jgi:hypothetical protein